MALNFPKRQRNHRRPATAFLIGIASLCLVAAACQSAEAPPPSPQPPSQPSASQQPLDDSARQEIRDGIREELQKDIDTLRQELEAEIRAEIKEELKAELEKQEPAPPPAPPTEKPLPHDDTRWETPGTHLNDLPALPRLIELVVGADIHNRLPEDIRLHYPTAPGVLYCYTVFENPTTESTVTHIWRRGARLVSKVELEVGSSPKWRTWSKQRTQPHWTGLWSCEVLNAEGEQLGLTVFRVGH